MIRMLCRYTAPGADASPDLLHPAHGLGENVYRILPHSLILREEKVISDRCMFAGFSAVTANSKDCTA